MTKNGGQNWDAPKAEPSGLSAEDLSTWRETMARVRALARQHGWSRSEVARRAGLKTPTFSMVYEGTYSGDVSRFVSELDRWLQSHAASSAIAAKLRPAPAWVPTPTAMEVRNALLIAQMLPDMVLVTLAPGMSKTMTAQHYVAETPHAYMVTMRPTTRATHAMLTELAEALEVAERNPIRRDRAIGEKLRRNGRETLLIVDEAQNLCDAAVDQLRHFLDLYECGIALLGNQELYTRFGRGTPRAGYGQLHRRVGKRLFRRKPRAEDIDAVISAWGVEDAEERKVLRDIGEKPGALGQISKTMQLAGIMAAGDDAAVDAAYIQRAWRNRGGGAEA